MFYEVLLEVLYKWLGVKDQKVTGQVSITFSKTPNYGLTDGEIILFVPHFKLPLFRQSFFPIFDPLFVFYQRIEKNQSDFQIQNFLLNHFKEKPSRENEFSRSSPEPENSRCGHQQPFNFLKFLPISRHFRTPQEN